MRTDPAETGGLFIGRRPGTAPIRFRTPPLRAGTVRQRVDGGLANGLLCAEILISILCWGPIPLACLWIGSEGQYLTGSAFLGFVIGFVALFPALFGALIALRRLDHAWVLVRRAAGRDQRRGVSPVVFALIAALVAVGFAIWFFVIHGPASPGNPSLEYHG
jgi:hypothetical protein